MCVFNYFFKYFTKRYNASNESKAADAAFAILEYRFCRPCVTDEFFNI